MLPPNSQRCRCLNPQGGPYEPGQCTRAMTQEDLICDQCRGADLCEARPGTHSGRLIHTRFLMGRPTDYAHER